MACALFSPCIVYGARGLFRWCSAPALILAGAFTTGWAAAEVTPPSSKPNIVIILADDLGYADLGCYGNGDVATPHLDRLAREGMRFTDFHANGPMCSPTRAALLTGRYQQRVGIEDALPLMKFPAKREGLPGDVVTIARRFSAAGYATAMMGKWHLGHHPLESPVHFGFDQFHGLLDGDGDYAAQISRLGVHDWWNGLDLALEPEAANTTSLITNYAVRFIEAHRDRPFFLYVPELAIHFPWMRPEDPPHRQLGRRYVGVKNPADSKLGPYVGSDQVENVVHAMIADLDRSVGVILAALDRFELAENTLVVFTSDNGGYTDYEGLHRGEISNNGPLRAGKGSLYEGGHRVPAIFRWPGRIAPGTESDVTALTFDLAPTFAELANLPPLPATSEQPFDGVSLAELLTEGKPPGARPLFWRMNATAAMRYGPWKLLKFPAGHIEIYDLVQDIGETTDLSARVPARAQQMQAALAAWEQEMGPPHPKRK